jgi:hypothetical protein
MNKKNKNKVIKNDPPNDKMISQCKAMGYEHLGDGIFQNKHGFWGYFVNRHFQKFSSEEL